MELSEEAREVIKKSKVLAKELNHRYAGSEHILVSLLSCSESARDILSIAGLDTLHFQQLSLSILKDTRMAKNAMEEKHPNKILLSPRSSKVLTHASRFAMDLGLDEISPGSILLGILNDISGMCHYLLSQLDIDGDELRGAVSGILGVELDDVVARRTIIGDTEDNMHAPPGPSDPHASTAPGGVTGKDSGSTLQKFTVDVTYKALNNELSKLVGREREIDRVIEILTRKSKNNPLLIGEPGVGKTAIVEGLAQRIVCSQVPDKLMMIRILQLDINAMVAGTVYRGQFEERLKDLIAELKTTPDVILFIDEIHTVMGAGASGGGSLDFSNVIKPELARGEISCIGVTTTNKYIELIEKDGAFNRRFQKIRIDEPTQEEMVEILKGIRGAYQDHHRVRYSVKCIRNIIDKCHRYIPDRRFPDKAIDVMDEIGSQLRYKLFKEYFYVNPELEDKLNEMMARKELAVKYEDSDELDILSAEEDKINTHIDDSISTWVGMEGKMIRIDEETVDDYFSKVTGIPVSSIKQDEGKKLKYLSSNITKHVVGQDDAVKEISKTIKRARLALHSPNKPIGVFLFLGQTGVGKTYLAKILNQLLFGTMDTVVQVNMSEMMEEHSISKIVGSPPGYVGHENVDSGSFLTRVKENPYCVVLLDEIEKAHPSILQILLQIFEEGTLRDSQGRDVSFRNCYIIMTSNIGAEVIHKSTTVGFGRDYSDEKLEIDDKLKKELNKHMAPELLNRIDSVVMFNNLKPKQLSKVCQLELDELRRILRKQIKVRLSWAKDVPVAIVDQCYEEGFGARPIKRHLHREVMDSISDTYLDNPDCKHIRIETDDDKLIYNIV